MSRLLFLIVALLLAQSALAHEVRRSIETTAAVAVRLSYADGQPFAYEAFEAYPEGKDVPAQVGRTDAQGRALFVPGEVRRWRLKAFTADGHGVDFTFDAPAFAAGPAPAPSAEGPNRASLLLFGFSVLLAAFGAYQLWLRKKP